MKKIFGFPKIFFIFYDYFGATSHLHDTKPFQFAICNLPFAI